MGGNKGSWEDGQRLRVFWDGAILRLFWNSKQQLNFLFCVFWEKPSNLFISYFCKTLNVLKVFTFKFDCITNCKILCTHKQQTTLCWPLLLKCNLKSLFCSVKSIGDWLWLFYIEETNELQQELVCGQ